MIAIAYENSNRVIEIIRNGILFNYENNKSAPLTHIAALSVDSEVFFYRVILLFVKGYTD